MRTVGRMHHAARLAARTAIAGAAAAAILWAGGGASPANAAPARAARAPKSADADGAVKTPVNINAADAEALATLPGIGSSIAQRIVDYRKEHGPFKSVDELVNVRGVGERLLARLREHVTIGAKE